VEVKVITEQKQKLHKMRLEGSSYSKIASALGISENTIKSIKSYCRRNNLNNLMHNL
jgi:DNA-directed RNA polymerase specialized sigma24 family protein